MRTRENVAIDVDRLRRGHRDSEVHRVRVVVRTVVDWRVVMTEPSTVPVASSLSVMFVMDAAFAAGERDGDRVDRHPFR